MTTGFPLISSAYAIVTVSVLAIELFRTRRGGIDAVSIFIALCLLQLYVPGVILYGLLPFTTTMDFTGIEAFDNILARTDAVSALLVLMLSTGFIFFFYLGDQIGARIIDGYQTEIRSNYDFVLHVNEKRLILILGGGVALTMLSFFLLGDSWFDRYKNLLLFRAADAGIERNALNANAFSLTQTWSWLAILGVFTFLRRPSRGLWFSFCIAVLVVLAVLGVSRRAIFLPVLISYLAFVLYTRRWRLALVAACAVPLVMFIAFGKNAFAAVAYGGSVNDVTGTYENWVNAGLRAACDIGITLVESLGTVQLMDIDLRFGRDHLVSMLQILPEKSLGFDFDFGDRIVRLSTAAFADESAQDIPPGLMGQMWLDFGILGPAAWGIVLGAQIGLLRNIHSRTVPTRASAALCTLLVFLIALPINTGSFDFTFSVDVVALMLALTCCVRLHRVTGYHLKMLHAPRERFTATAMHSIPRT